MEIRQEGEDTLVQIGVECTLNPQKTLTQPLTFRFNKKVVEGYFTEIDAKIKYLQQRARIMPPAQRERLKGEVNRIEAYRSSDIQHVFESGKPDLETQEKIMKDSRGSIKFDEHLLMRNADEARRYALFLARLCRDTGKPLFDVEDIKEIQGEIYWGVNALRGLSSHMQRGYVLTGKLKKDMNGDLTNGFKTIHPEVTPLFLDEMVDFIASKEARAMHPLLAGYLIRTMNVLIHPFDDGNGRASGILFESCVSNWRGGELDMYGLVTITPDLGRPSIGGRRRSAIDNLTNPSTTGEVNMTLYIREAAQVMHDMVDEAFARADIKMPVRGAVVA